MTAQTFSLTVILIAAPIWLLAIVATAKDADFLPTAIATVFMCGLTLSVAWGIRLIVLNL